MSSKLKIAVYHNLPSGGAKRSLFEVVKRLSTEQTIDVFTLSTSDKNFCALQPFVRKHKIIEFSTCKQLNSPFGRINQIQRIRDILNLNKLSQKIAREIDVNGYDVVFAQPCMWTQAPLVLRYLKTPSVYYCHEPPRNLYDSNFSRNTKNWKNKFNHVDPSIFLYKNIAKTFDESSTRSASIVLVNSLFTKEIVSRIYGINSHVCYHGVDTDVFHKSNAIEKKPYFLSVGAIQSTKGFDFLIRSLGNLEKLKPWLKIIGNMEIYEERRYLQGLAIKNHVKLHIEVGVSLESLVHSYNESSLVLYSPINEPFGLVPLEAMACGTPVIAVNEGGVKETIVHERTGLLIDRDPVKFSNAILQLIRNPKKMAEFSKFSQAYIVENWSWEHSVTELVGYFESCMKPFRDDWHKKSKAQVTKVINGNHP